MARVAIFPCALSMNDDLSGNAIQSNGRFPGSYAYTLAPDAASATAQESTATFAVALKTFYFRAYIRIRAYPNAGGLRFISGRNSIEGLDDAWYFRLQSNGTIRAYSEGNLAAVTVASGTTVLGLNQWYRLNGQVTFRGPIGGSGANLLKLSIDGVQEFSASTSTSNAGINQSTAVGTQIEMGGTGFTSDRDGGQIEISDFVVDDAAPPEAGGITLFRVKSDGTYQDWGGSWRQVSRRHPGGQVTAPGSVPSLSNAVVNAKSTFNIETFASKGLSGVTVKSHWVVAFGTTVRANNQYILRINSVDNLSPTFAAQSKVFLASSLDGRSSTVQGWWQEASALALLPGDTIEIGFEDGPAGAGTSNITGMYFIAEWEGADPVVTPETDNDVIIEHGTYSGIGAGDGQRISLANPAIDPTFLLIIGDDVGALQRVFWARGFGSAGDNAIAIASQNLLDQGLAKVDQGGFEVYGDGGTVNESGITFRYLAIQDRTGRFLRSGVRGLATAGSIDNIDVPIDDAEFSYATLTPATTFVVDTLITGIPRPTSIATNDKSWFRTSVYTGDSSSSLNSASAATTDAIQSLGTGTFQLGTKANRTAANAGTVCWVALNGQEASFFDRHMFEAGSWTGDGTGSRVISFQFAGEGSYVMVVPANASARYYRFFNDGNGTTSRALLDGVTSTTAITAFATNGQMTVNSSLNASGVVYHYIVFGVGTDSNGGEISLTQAVASVTAATGPFTADLCDDCGCRMLAVLPEDRLQVIPREIRNKVISLESRTEIILLDRRTKSIPFENREEEIECA